MSLNARDTARMADLEQRLRRLEQQTRHIPSRIGQRAPLLPLRTALVEDDSQSGGTTAEIVLAPTKLDDYILIHARGGSRSAPTSSSSSTGFYSFFELETRLDLSGSTIQGASAWKRVGLAAGTADKGVTSTGVVNNCFPEVGSTDGTIFNDTLTTIFALAYSGGSIANVRIKVNTSTNEVTLQVVPTNGSCDYQVISGMLLQDAA